MKIIIYILVFGFFISGCGADSSVIKSTGSNENFTKEPDVNFKNERNHLLPKAISSIISIKDEGGEAAVIKHLQTCYETQLKKNIGLTHELGS